MFQVYTLPRVKPHCLVYLLLINHHSKNQHYRQNLKDKETCKNCNQNLMDKQGSLKELKHLWLMATYKYQLDTDTLYHLNSTYRSGIYFKYSYLYSNSQQGKPCMSRLLCQMYMSQLRS